MSDQTEEPVFEICTQPTFVCPLCHSYLECGEPCPCYTEGIQNYMDFTEPPEPPEYADYADYGDFMTFDDIATVTNTDPKAELTAQMMKDLMKDLMARKQCPSNRSMPHIL